MTPPSRPALYPAVPPGTPGWPHRIPVELSEDELVQLGRLAEKDGAPELARKLRASQIQAFALWHG